MVSRFPLLDETKHTLREIRTRSTDMIHFQLGEWTEWQHLLSNKMPHRVGFVNLPWLLCTGQHWWNSAGNILQNLIQVLRDNIGAAITKKVVASTDFGHHTWQGGGGIGTGSTSCERACPSMRKENLQSLIHMQQELLQTGGKLAVSDFICDRCYCKEKTGILWFECNRSCLTKSKSVCNSICLKKNPRLQVFHLFATAPVASELETASLEWSRDISCRICIRDRKSLPDPSLAAPSCCK